MKNKIIIVTAFLAVMVALTGAASATQVSYQLHDGTIKPIFFMENNSDLTLDMLLSNMAQIDIGRTVHYNLGFLQCINSTGQLGVNCGPGDLNLQPLTDDFLITQAPTQLVPGEAKIHMHAPISREPGTLYSFAGSVTNFSPPEVPAQVSLRVGLLGANITGKKCNDLNGDGICGQGDPGLAGWTIILLDENGTEVNRTTTDANGNYAFRGPFVEGQFLGLRGTFTVEEVLQPGWMQTGPKPVPPGTYTVTIDSQDATGLNFANTQLFPNITLTKTPSSPKVEIGSQVTYTYNVTNTGNTVLNNVSITDNTAVTPNPVTSGQTLNVGETKIFTATAKLTTIGYTNNTATATGKDAIGGTASANATASVRVINPKITLTKTASPTSGLAPLNVTYTYNVTNTGDVILTNVGITDNTAVTPNPVTSGQTLNVGEMKTFTATAVITTNTTNTATATGTDQTGAMVNATATATVTVKHPAISLNKTASAPKVENGSSVTYTYNATNTGDIPLTVNISDDKLGVILAPTIIAAGASTGPITKTTTLTTTNTAITNTATATGTDQTGASVNATASQTVKVIHPAISLTKTASPTSGTAPLNVTYTYTVNNTGDTALSNVTITDNVFGAVGGPITLNSGASQTFTKTETITANTTNIATATGTDQTGAMVNATATATVAVIPPVGNQGCTPGFWKENALKHGASQWPAPFTPTETLAAAGFANATVVDLSNTTLLQALQFKGGPGLGGAEQILLRAAVSSLLNSASTGVKFPLTTSQVLSEVNTALATQNRDTILALASQLDQDNNLGCPLSQNT